jgi:hypothetical protein
MTLYVSFHHACIKDFKYASNSSVKRTFYNVIAVHWPHATSWRPCMVSNITEKRYTKKKHAANYVTPIY